jgi:hypothetical protein
MTTECTAPYAARAPSASVNHLSGGVTTRSLGQGAGCCRFGTSVVAGRLDVAGGLPRTTRESHRR